MAKAVGKSQLASVNIGTTNIATDHLSVGQVLCWQKSVGKYFQRQINCQLANEKNEKKFRGRWGMSIGILQSWSNVPPPEY